MALQTNAAMIDAVLAKLPGFMGNASEYARQLVTERGFDQVEAIDPTVKTNFMVGIFKFYYQFINVPDTRDWLAVNDVGEVYDMPYGYYAERMAMSQIKERNPAYVGLANGDSVDPYVINAPLVESRYFEQNDDFQAWITMFDRFNWKGFYTSEYGIDQYMRGLMKELNNVYVRHRYNLKMECIDKFINGVITPLQPTQIVETGITLDDGTYDVDFILKIKNIITMMVTNISTAQFNAAGYDTVQDRSRLRLLIKQGFKNAIETRTLVGAFNPKYLSMDVPIIEVPFFGNGIPYKEPALTTPLYPVFNKDGVLQGYTETQGGTTVTVQTGAAYYKDPNPEIVAMLIDKGLFFETIQNPYQVEPARNAMGRYTNMIASAPNNGIHFDNYYNAVIFKQVIQEPEEEPEEEPKEELEEEP